MALWDWVFTTCDDDHSGTGPHIRFAFSFNVELGCTSGRRTLHSLINEYGVGVWMPQGGLCAPYRAPSHYACWSSSSSMPTIS